MSGGVMMRNLHNCVRFHQKGFTLIELMVVVVIIAIFSGLLIPRLLSVYDRARRDRGDQSLIEQSVQERQKGEEFTLPPGVLPVIESAKMNMFLLSSYHRVGMRVYTRYEVQCQGRLEFRRSTQDKNPVLLTIPLPEGRAEARDVRFTLKRLSDSTTWEPDNLVYHGPLSACPILRPGSLIILSIMVNVSIGAETFRRMSDFLLKSIL
jgi:prepilin-type N-terminal cleavage/methylation domain-containing protein